MMYSTPYRALFDDFFSYNRRPSVYVISDSQLAEFKQQQLDAELAELDKLIESHKQSIQRLEDTKQKLILPTGNASLKSSEQSSLQASDDS